MTLKEFTSTNLDILPKDKNEIINEDIIFIDFSTKNNLLLLLTSNNTFYMCEIVDNSIRIKQKFEGIVNKGTKISKIYFCNEDLDIILLLCDDGNILEWMVSREYISHIFYDVLGDSYEFKMNNQKNSGIESNIKNFCIFQKGEIKVWNTLKFNKKNILYIQNVNCFSYDFSGILLYFITKTNQKNNLKVIKFCDEYDCKEIFNKILNYKDSQTNIDYINSFDVNLILSDTKCGNIFIYKFHPINKIEFTISLNNNPNHLSPLFIPFIGQNPLYQFGILCINIKENEQKIVSICYESKKFNIDNIILKISNPYFIKENISEKGLLLEFDNISKELRKYFI